jgi:hypothetical protein
LGPCAWHGGLRGHKGRQIRKLSRTTDKLAVIAASALLLVAVGGAPPQIASAQSVSGQSLKAAEPKFSVPRAFDVSPALTELARRARSARVTSGSSEPLDIRPDRGPVGVDRPFAGDGALTARTGSPSAAAVAAPLTNFEGLSNQDNLNVIGFRVNPPDPVGAVGPNHYVEMVNLVFGVYSKTGTLLLGPVDTGTLWSGFAVPDCTDPSGDPIVVHDQFADRWILTQFTTRGPEYFNCIAVSQTGDPTAAYFRYAFSAGVNFPDYPKYGVWSDSYVLTTREFGPTTEYGIGVYGFEKNEMVRGNPKARSVRFFLDGNDPALAPLVGDGLLPADVDGKQRPKTETPIPLVGTQDDGAFYGATRDALNVWELEVKWRSMPTASVGLKTQLPVASFDSIFPCAPDSRDCLPQPGVIERVRYLDILSYRQRPTFRLAYRDFGTHESLVTSQSVEALPGVAGLRWYELRRTNGTYSLHQQGTHAPNDGVHRWMGSIAMDRLGNMALGYSVVNGTSVFPGIRYTGRLAGDALGQMTLDEGVIVNGTGVQQALSSRWGDYTAMTVDPTDDCTFWYVNEYYTAAGEASSQAGWQTRIASFKFPGCAPL